MIICGIRRSFLIWEIATVLSSCVGVGPPKYLLLPVHSKNLLITIVFRVSLNKASISTLSVEGATLA